MTNTLALIFGAIILAVVAADFFFFDWMILVTLGIKLAEFVEYLAFWR